MPNEGRVRRASAADAGRMAEIRVAAWHDAYRTLVPKELLASIDVASATGDIESALSRPPTPDHRAWVVTLADEVRGFCLTGPTRDEDGDVTSTMEIQGLYVDPEYKGRGLGRTALTWSVDDVRDRSYADVTLWVLEKNREGRRFYETAGFRIDGPAAPIEVRGHELPHLRYRKVF